MASPATRWEVRKKGRYKTGWGAWCLGWIGIFWMVARAAAEPAEGGDVNQKGPTYASNTAGDGPEAEVFVS